MKFLSQHSQNNSFTLTTTIIILQFLPYNLGNSSPSIAIHQYTFYGSDAYKAAFSAHPLSQTHTSKSSRTPLPALPLSPYYTLPQATHLSILH